VSVDPQQKQTKKKNKKNNKKKQTITHTKNTTLSLAWFVNKGERFLRKKKFKKKTNERRNNVEGDCRAFGFPKPTYLYPTSL